MPDAPKIPEIRTRKPTGKPPWPMVLLAGGEKSGKSWAAAEFSGSDLIGRTFYIEIGEHYADEYGAIPGARYEIVQHDGTYRGIGNAVWAATKQECIDGKPNCIVVDSMTLLWDMLSDQAQRTAYARWRKRNPKAAEPDDEIQVTMDLWNTAKDKFANIVNLLRGHNGPVILTARLEQVTVMAGGKPTTDKTWKVRAEKNLPYEVDAVVQMPAPRRFQVTGVRSTRFQLEPGAAKEMPGFTLDGFLRQLGLDQEGATAPRSVTLTRPDERSQPTRPAEDQWGTARPASASGASRPRSCNPAQRKQLGDLALAKLGLSGEKDLLGAFGDAVGRALARPGDLTYDEAKQLIERLTAAPDHRGAQAAPPAMKADAATPPPPARPDEPKVLADLRAAIGKAAVSDLEGIWQDAKAAFEDGKLTKDQAATVESLCDQRYLQVSGEVANAS